MLFLLNKHVQQSLIDVFACYWFGSLLKWMLQRIAIITVSIRLN